MPSGTSTAPCWQRCVPTKISADTQNCVVLSGAEFGEKGGVHPTRDRFTGEGKGGVSPPNNPVFRTFERSIYASYDSDLGSYPAYCSGVPLL